MTLAHLLASGYIAIPDVKRCEENILRNEFLHSGFLELK